MGVWINCMYDLVAIHPLFDNGDPELRALTWNVHRAAIVDERQQIEMVKVVETDLTDHNMLVVDFTFAQ